MSKWFHILALWLLWGLATPLFAETSTDRIYQNLTDGDTQQLYENVRQVFVEMGIEFNSNLTFRTRAYDEPVSWYNAIHDDMMLSRLMRPDQARSYWINWSRILTNGVWNIDEVFEDKKDMHLLGNYNILTILAHEIGHYVGAQYGLNTPEDGYNELVGDKVAIFFLNYLAVSDERFLHLRDRYRDLITIGLHDAAPRDIRIDIPDWGDLDAFCRKMPLPEDMPRYVSLHMARHRRLLADDRYTDYVWFFNKHIRPVNERYQSGTIYDTRYHSIQDLGEIGYEYSQFSGILTSGEVFRVDYAVEGDTTFVLQLLTPDTTEDHVIATYPLASLIPEVTVWSALETMLKKHEPHIYYLEGYIKQIYFLSPDEWVIHFDEQPSRKLPDRLFHYTKEKGRLTTRRIPTDTLFQDVLHFSIIGLNQADLYFSRIITSGYHLVWEYGNVTLATGQTRIMGRHIASIDYAFITDGPVGEVLMNAKALVKGATWGSDQTLYFSHADMIKTYKSGLIKTVAGRRAGESPSGTGDALWHPHVIGLDTDGRLFVKSIRKVIDKEEIRIVHRLKVLE